MIVTILRALRALFWLAAAALSMQQCIELRYAYAKQDTVFQQTAIGPVAICWLIATLTCALAADRIFAIGERFALGRSTSETGR